MIFFQQSFISFLHRGVPADIQIDIDEDRETERIYSLFTLSLLKLQKMEGNYIIKFFYITMILCYQFLKCCFGITLKSKDIHRFIKMLPDGS